MPRLKEYHFSAGNSSRGPIGFCARVRARTKKEAVELLRAALPEEMEVNSEEHPAVVYIEIYISEAALAPRHIDEVASADPEDVIEANDDTCRECGGPTPLGGDGWDGLCGNCADRAERQRQLG